MSCGEFHDWNNFRVRSALDSRVILISLQRLTILWTKASRTSGLTPEALELASVTLADPLLCPCFFWVLRERIIIIVADG
jgi:hypothetical protein